AVPLSAAPQAGHEPHHGSGPVPREILERPVALRTGIGTLHEKVATSSQEAQAFYDQGLAYIHSYVWIEAIRSFHQALRLDPNMAMAYLGLTDAYIGMHDPATARTAFQRAQELAPKLNENEQMWGAIRARELDYLESEGDSDKYVAYRKSISDALKANPNDPWLWIQRGLADEGSPLTHGQVGGVDTIAFYRTALALDPDNFAAHHYYGHTLENLGRTKEALDETAIYLRMAPAIPHAHHMHGHELMRLGRTDEAIAEFLKTKSLEEEYYRTENIPSRYDWHHAHNLYLLAMSYESLGQMKAAEAAFREAFAVPPYTDFLDFNRKAWPEFLLARGRNGEALRASQELTKSEWPLPRLAGHTLAGQALLATNRLNDAQEELSLAEQETEHLPLNLVATSPFPSTLRAEFLLRDKKIEEGEALLQDIVKMILARPGPDAWSAARFELDSLARSARESGDWKLSESIARDMIQHDATYAGGYFALGLAAEHAGHSAQAREQFAAAEKFWSKADRDLPELRRIQEGLSARR
ncbi:MAG TPA: tetratricopeptide repeat protein, partial [Candidatus Dormibacteraeota bacterium]|nr:tetratricopeptide repeat protein [Candidatus Dormibacteraeota bacterium]